MNTKRARVIALVLAAIMVFSAVVLTGCDDKKSDDNKSATQAATTAATTATEAPTETATQAQAPADAETQAQNNDDSQNDSQTAVDADGYISEQDAIANLRQLIGTGAQVIDYYKGYTPDGTPAWVVTVAPITNSEDPVYVTYYSGYLFCYADTANQNNDDTPVDQPSVEFDDDGYINEQDAVANVKQLAGTGAQIVDYYKGYTPDGTPAWVVTVAPITNSEDPVYITYYSGYLFCYPAD